MILFGNINKGLEEYRSTPGSLLVDVREKDEFRSGHIPDAVNEPLSGIANTTMPKGETAIEDIVSAANGYKIIKDRVYAVVFV